MNVYMAQQLFLENKMYFKNNQKERLLCEQNQFQQTLTG